MTDISAPRRARLTQFTIWLMFTATILGTALLSAYYPIWANVPFNIFGSLYVLICLKPVFFERLKLTTLLLMRAFIVLAVIGLVPGDFYVKAVLVFLIINILEATFTDLKHKQYFNFVSGLALAAGVFALSGKWLGGLYTADTATVLGTIAWFIAYTIWNWVFVTGEFSPAISLMHVGFLLAPIFGVIVTGNPGLWLLLRANTLTFGGILQIGNKQYFEDAFTNEKFARFVDFTHKNAVQCVLMLINLALIVYSFAGKLF